MDGRTNGRMFQRDSLKNTDFANTFSVTDTRYEASLTGRANRRYKSK